MLCGSEPEPGQTYKLEQADVLPQRSHAAGEAQDEGDSAHHQNQPDRVKAVQLGHPGQVQQNPLQTEQVGQFCPLQTGRGSEVRSPHLLAPRPEPDGNEGGSGQLQQNQNQSHTEGRTQVLQPEPDQRVLTG